MARIKLTYQPDYENYLRINRATTYNKPTIVLAVVMGFMSIATVLGLAFGWIDAGSRILLYLLPPLMFIYFLIYTPIKLRRQAKELAEKNLTIEWRLSRAGITVDSNGEKQKYSWETFGATQELDQDYILFFKTNRSDYIFFPKDAFDNKDQEQQFREMVKTNIGGFK